MNDRKRYEEQLKTKADTLRSFYDSATVMMGTVRLTDDDIAHVSDNRAAATFFKTTAEAMQGKAARALGVSEAYVRMWLEAYRASLRSGEPIRFDYHHEGKGWLKVTVNYIGSDGGEPHFSYVVDDISERKRGEEALRRAHDALTGLPNRAIFADRLGRSIGRVKRRPEAGFTVLFCDLDHFKVINDSLGHEVGDQLLVALGQRLGGCIREGDTLARLGGDEFTLLLEDCDLAQAGEVIGRLRAAMSVPFELQGRELFVSVSIGVVLSDNIYTRPEEMLRDADTAMYRAKAEGPGHYVVFDRTMREQADRRLILGSELRRALERGEFGVYYQPIVKLAGARPVGFEALVRWRHPERGLVSPDDFIAVAEETGLIIALDRYVLGEACRQLGAWQRRFRDREPLFLSVNLSSRQFMRPDLVAYVEATLARTEVRPGSLNLEITETLLMNPLERVNATTAQLKTLGVGLYLDDFGTSYSSLAYLQRFPADALKIDRSFVQHMTGSAESGELVRTILVMARALGLRVVAEGVETPEVAAQLSALGCEYAQGYLFAKPLSAEQAEAFIATR